MAGELIRYLLCLALDADERQKFRTSRDAADQAMCDAGLSDHYRDLLLDGTTHQISEAVEKELRREDDPAEPALEVLCHMSVVKSW
ncbi:MAG: hypothetical protein M3M96_07445 [Candidatus Eremiobacteraeota bacterium]|nr:hypothetical protein [Candidatus Eremiobacteraeota bacterium]